MAWMGKMFGSGRQKLSLRNQDVEMKCSKHRQEIRVGMSILMSYRERCCESDLGPRCAIRLICDVKPDLKDPTDSSVRSRHGLAHPMRLSCDVEVDVYQPTEPQSLEARWLLAQCSSDSTIAAVKPSHRIRCDQLKVGHLVPIQSSLRFHFGVSGTIQSPVYPI